MLDSSMILEPSRLIAALPSLKQYTAVFHLPASINAIRLSPSTRIKIAVFDEQATSPECHEPETQEKS
jgi:hypothetical protein